MRFSSPAVLILCVLHCPLIRDSEAKILQNLDHPHILRIFSWYEDGDSINIALASGPVPTPSDKPIVLVQCKDTSCCLMHQGDQQTYYVYQ